jgi:hypothetical protein
MLAIFVLVLWIAWLVARTWLRRNDPDGLALITGETEVAQPAPQVAARTATQPTYTTPRPAVAAPPAVGALTPRSPAAYGSIPAYDRRMGERRRTRVALDAASDRRHNDRRVSA